MCIPMGSGTHLKPSPCVFGVTGIFETVLVTLDKEAQTVPEAQRRGGTWRNKGEGQRREGHGVGSVKMIHSIVVFGACVALIHTAANSQRYTKVRRF